MMPVDLGSSAEAVAIDLEECVARLDERGCDLSHVEGVASAAELLAGLSANRSFLIEQAMAELRQRCAGQQAGNRYGAQVLMLARRPGAWFIRANFWPAVNDPVLQASGAEHYFYHVPHDHNFDFVTAGYWGPGYRSNWYERSDQALTGVPGEAAGLHLIEQGQLAEGRLMHYRAHRDVHDQLPPSSLSISLNIVADQPGIIWRDQYLFDTASDEVSGLPTLSQGEIIMAIAVQLGGDNAMDLAAHLARSHPSERARWSAWQAMAGVEDEVGRRSLYERATMESSPLVRGMAKLFLDRMDARALHHDCR